MKGMNRFAPAFLALSVFGLCSAASAAGYPERPIKIVTPYAAGGSTDYLARLVAQRLSDRLGQPVVVENKPGASEQIAAVAVARNSAPDGYTLMLTTTAGLAINPGLYGSSLQYDPQKDFAPIIPAAAVPSLVVVNPSVPAKTFQELTAYIKANPGKLSYASAGVGTPSHLGMELYKRAAGLDIVHVPFKGGAPAIQSIVAEQVQVMMPVMSEAMPMTKAAKLKALAVASSEPLPQYPGLPTVSDAGLKGFGLDLYYVFVAPVKTPRDVVAKLNAEINAVLKEPDTRQKIQENGLNVLGGSASALADMVARDIPKYKQVIEAANIKLD